MVMYESNALEVKLVKISFNVQMSATEKNIFNGKNVCKIMFVLTWSLNLRFTRSSPKHSDLNLKLKILN